MHGRCSLHRESCCFAQSQEWEGKVQQQLLREPPRKNLFSQFSGRLKEINLGYSPSALLTLGVG